MNKVLFSSKKIYWNTLKELYNKLNECFKFDFDPCPIDPSFDGLNISWGKCNYINPLYGREIYNWVKKTIEEYLKNKICVLLIPARTDTKYFYDLILPYVSEIHFIKGRLKFNDCGSPAPFPSMICFFIPYSGKQKIIKGVNNLGD